MTGIQIWPVILNHSKFQTEKSDASLEGKYTLRRVWAKCVCFYGNFMIERFKRKVG